ncbi:MAG: hypothetical protein AAF998_02740 [Bacteroidota bacterium]
MKMQDKTDYNGPSKGEHPEKEFGLSPETELWVPPDDCPQVVIDDHMPGLEQSRMDATWMLFFKTRPSWWNDRYGLAVANARRKQLYQLWKDGELDVLLNEN